MEYFAISAVVNAITSTVLGVVIFLRNPKDQISVFFGLFAFFVGSWSIAYFFWQLAADATSALFWSRTLMSFAIFIPFVFLDFVIRFLGLRSQYRWFTNVGYVLGILFLAIAWTPLFISGVEPRGGVTFWPVAGQYFLLFLAAWGFYVLYSEYLLLKAVRSTTDHGKRSQLLYILFGTTVGYAGGATNYFLWYNIQIPPYGNILVTIYVVSVAYAILRHRLFDIRVIATELLIFSLWLALFVRLLLEQTVQGQLTDGALLIVTVIVGVLLIRSVDREVEQRERIEQLSNEKSEFMTFASHEIRNPITAMRGYASLISDGTTGQVSTQVKDVSDKILVLGDEVLALIGQFLSKSKMELGQIQYSSDLFDLGAAASIIADGYKPHAEQKGLQLIKLIDPSEHLMVKADQTKVKEVIGNIIDNALKYTRQGSITIAVERHGISVRVVVSDTGVGIPAETIPHLFKKFSRADAQKVNLLGTGIGLYLAKTFIEAMGGRIWAESEGTDKGSRFIIEFPSAA